MKFGPVPVAEAEGAVLAHSMKLGSRRLRKGAVIGAGDIAQMQADGIAQVIVARAGPKDADENTAAAWLARALVPDAGATGLTVTDPFTGRVNLLAAGPGVAALDVEALHAFNAVHPMITVATVPPWQQMAKGGMVATIKIIAYAVPEAAVAQAARAGAGAIRLRRPEMRDAGLVVTEIPGGPSNDKGIDAIRGRVEALGMNLAEVAAVPHDSAALAGALAGLKGDIVLILTGSATSDIADVAPEAVRAAGGQVDRFGMPVDPGNLLFLGRLSGRPVIGLPGCARSPALNGADWVLSRIACGVPVAGADIAAMGVGGLLKEIPTRPQPRAGARRG